MSQFFAFVHEGGGLRPEDRIWVWAFLGLCIVGLALLPWLGGARRRWRRRRKHREML